MSNDDKAREIHLRLTAERAAHANSPDELAEIFAQMSAHLEAETIRKIFERDLQRVLDGRQH